MQSHIEPLVDSGLRAMASVEWVDGAQVRGLDDPARHLVRAYMKGVRETAGLKFDRAGLDTTASREGRRLTIQTGLGAGRARTIVVHVEGLSAVVLYTDPHPARVRFFQDLLHTEGVRWSVPDAAEHEINAGHYSAETPANLEAYLTRLGSHLVFLIDWNRARKRLARLVSKVDALELLKWAAEQKVGHRAFLMAGDLHLIETARMRAAARRRATVRLDEWLGRDRARSFLMAVLRATSAGLKAGHSQAVIEDEVYAELTRHLESADTDILSGAAEQAATMLATVESIRVTLSGLRCAGGDGEGARMAETARALASEAGRIGRDTARRLDLISNADPLRTLLVAADTATDALAETVFLATLVRGPIDPQLFVLLERLASHVEDEVREYTNCLQAGQGLSRRSGSAELDQFFVAVERLAGMGGGAVDARRAMTEQLMRGRNDANAFYVLVRIGEGFERAATALTRCGVVVRDYVLTTRLDA